MPHPIITHSYFHFHPHFWLGCRMEKESPLEALKTHRSLRPSSTDLFPLPFLMPGRKAICTGSLPAAKQAGQQALPKQGTGVQEVAWVPACSALRQGGREGTRGLLYTKQMRHKPILPGHRHSGGTAADFTHLFL